MFDSLRIAQVAPIVGPVSPETGASIEHLVWLLTEELVRRGHDVTLFAAGDSCTSARLRSVYGKGYDFDDDLWDWQFHETMHVAAAFESAHEFDVIHSHAYHYALPFTRLVGTPVVHTYHTLLDDDIVRVYARYPEAHVAAISQYQRSVLAGVRSASVVYNGIDTASFPYNPTAGDHLFFLGRMIPDKGPVEAIKMAKMAGMKLVMAGPGDDDYFRNEVRPLVDGKSVEYVGPVNKEERNILLAGAAALLYPVIVPEPFGLVMAEAMACGTPVAALNCGAVPEIVQCGVSGHHADDLAHLTDLLPDTIALDRASVRDYAVTRFDYRHMVDGYLALYSRLVAARKQEAIR
jgi:glycosyltransferase involved in cell wall biosynthesis